MATDFPVTIRRLRSSKSLRLRVLASGQVLLTVPQLAPQRLIDRFLVEHLEWVTTQQLKVANRQQSLTASRPALFYRGKEYQFRLAISTARKSGVGISNDQLIVTSPSEDNQKVRQILEQWYIGRAKDYFIPRVPLLADVVNQEVKRVTVRSVQSRWGSCSNNRTISLNWRLIMAPDKVSDYVIYHELAHLTHLNHSRAFWKLVTDYFPNFPKAKQWLVDHHQLLEF